MAMGRGGREALAAAEAAYARRLDEDLDRIVRRLRDMGATLVVLFGSAARGRRDLFTDVTRVDNAPGWTERQRVAHLHSLQRLVGGAWESKS